MSLICIDLPNAGAKRCKNLTGYAAMHGVTLSNSCFNTCGLAGKDLAHSIYAIVIHWHSLEPPWDLLKSRTRTLTVPSNGVHCSPSCKAYHESSISLVSFVAKRIHKDTMSTGKGVKENLHEIHCASLCLKLCILLLCHFGDEGFLPQHLQLVQ